MGHHDNTKSTTVSVRVPLWLHEETSKLKRGDESYSAVVVRALVALVAEQGGRTDGD